MYDLTIKDGKEDKFKGVNDLSMLEIKKKMIKMILTLF